MIKFPSVEQFRHAIRQVKDRVAYVGKDEDGNPIYDYSRTPPTLEFRGYVNLHGSNGGVVSDLHEDTIIYQSRERVITPGDDNAGFAAFMSQHDDVVGHINDSLVRLFPDKIIKQTAIFGEWCGEGIQKGVAITQLPKMFVVFALKIIEQNGDSMWIDPAMVPFHFEEERIFNISTFGWYTIIIDFNQPELSQNSLIEMTTWVENECPVGKYFYNKFNGFIVNRNTVNYLPINLAEKCKEILKTEEEIQISF